MAAVDTARCLAQLHTTKIKHTCLPTAQAARHVQGYDAFLSRFFRFQTGCVKPSARTSSTSTPEPTSCCWTACWWRSRTLSSSVS